MVQTPTMGWGLVATRDVDEGDQLILLPKALQLTYDYNESAPGKGGTHPHDVTDRHSPFGRRRWR